MDLLLKYFKKISLDIKNGYCVKIHPVINITRNFTHISGCNEQKISNKISGVNSFAKPTNLYKAPKNILHNAYDIVAKELNREFKLQPVYNIVKGLNKNSSWRCTYHLKWPEIKKFESVGQTKKEASHNAAVCALLWLQKVNKITEDGYPVTIEKNKVKEIVTKEKPKLILDSHTLNQMEAIVKIYRNEFQSLENNQNRLNHRCDTKDVNEFKDEELKQKNLDKKLFTPSKYFTREKKVLPISEYKDKFIDLLNENRIVIIKGEPGCGKSTRIPQYILESWARHLNSHEAPCQIAVAQPRRIAAVSLARRVCDERDEHCGHIVGYQVRLNSNFDPHTGRILFCTTGILLNYLQSDISLRNFSHVILDEAHERDVNIDLLMSLLKKSMEQNQQLKIIVMSATIDTSLFKDYFNNAPVMHVPGFTFPVKSYFLDDLDADLSKSYTISSENTRNPHVAHDDVVKVINYIHKTKAEGGILCFLPSWEDIIQVKKRLYSYDDVLVLCLHSRLRDEDQKKIFCKTPPGIRKIILCTNIAETSITIDDIIYVIDTGIHKESRFNHEKGVTSIDNYWISQASMNQRKGRAGRVQPGECFHLYTKSRYDTFPTFTDPGMLKTALTKIVLDSKVYSNNMNAIEFMSQLPTPPDENTTRRAIRELQELKLLDDNENLTSLGRILSHFQLEPKFAKTLVNAIIYKCLTPIVDIVTIFSGSTEIFSGALTDKEAMKNTKAEICKDSDHLAVMGLFETWLKLMQDTSTAAAKRYCSDADLDHYKLETINKLRRVHFDYLQNRLYQVLPFSDDYSGNEELIKAVLYSGVGTLLRHQNWEIVKGRLRRKSVFYTNNNQRASITSDSVNYKKTSFPSDFLVYFNETRSNVRKTTLIRECSSLSPIAIVLFSDRDLIINKIENNDNDVKLAVCGRNVEFICSKEEAYQIQNCKEALNSAYSYFIRQMTESGEWNLEINGVWDKILGRLNSLLSLHIADK